MYQTTSLVSYIQSSFMLSYSSSYLSFFAYSNILFYSFSHLVNIISYILQLTHIFFLVIYSCILSYVLILYSFLASSHAHVILCSYSTLTYYHLSRVLLMLYSSISLPFSYSSHFISFCVPYLISSHLFALLVLYACPFSYSYPYHAFSYSSYTCFYILNFSCHNILFSSRPNGPNLI